MDADGLSGLEEPDQFEPVEALGSGLIGVDVRETCVDRRLGDDQAVDMSKPEEPTDRVHHRHDRGVHEPAVELSDVELDVRALC